MHDTELLGRDEPTIVAFVELVVRNLVAVRALARRG